MPIEACEMALLRVVHAAGLPDPGELARMLREGGTPATAPLSSEPPPSSPPPQPAPEAQAPDNFRALLEMLWNEGESSERRRLGKGCVRTGTSGWAADP